MPTPVFVNSASSSTAPGASVGLGGWWREMRQHQFLISQLTRREVVGRALIVVGVALLVAGQA